MPEITTVNSSEWLRPSLTAGMETALRNLTVGGLNYPTVNLPTNNTPRVVLGCGGATYTQSGTTVTVTWTAHGMTAVLNGADVHLTQSTGALLTGWFSNFTYVSANTFTCTSGVSQTTSGNLGSNTTKTAALSLAVPAGVLGLSGTLLAHATWAVKNSAANKQLQIDFGAFQIWETGVTASNVFTTLAGVVNCNSASIQRAIATPYGGGVAGTNVAPALGAVNTAVTQNIVLSATLAANTEWAGVWAPNVSCRYGA